MKTTAVVESLSTIQPDVLFQRLPAYFKMKEDVAYEEFLAAVYKAETEGSEGKIVSAKAKALTVEKVIESRDQSELKGLRQQIESLATIMNSTTVGSSKPKVIAGVSSPRKKELSGGSPQKHFQGHQSRLRDLSNQGRSL